jgi:hypothetical protein
MVGHQYKRTTVVAVALIAVAASMTAMAGCSGNGAADEPHDRTARSAVATVRRVPDVLARTGSSKTRTSIEMVTGETRITITGKGGYDYARRLGKLRVVLPESPSGESPSGSAKHRPITELLAPGALYMKNRGAGVPSDKWVQIDTATLADGNLVTSGATDPVSAAELLRGARRVTYAGETELGGAKVRHYQGTLDLERAAKAAPAHARGALEAAAKGFAKDTVPFDAYLDEQGRVRKVRYRFNFANGPDRTPIAVSSTTLYYDFGAPVSVQLPPSEDIFAGKIAAP